MANICIFILITLFIYKKKMENHENILKEVKRILFLTEYDPKKGYK
jgi:hypothetical protein